MWVIIGGVLHVHDFVDFVSEEAEIAGKAAASCITGKKVIFRKKTFGKIEYFEFICINLLTNYDACVRINSYLLLKFIDKMWQRCVWQSVAPNNEAHSRSERCGRRDLQVGASLNFGCIY